MKIIETIIYSVSRCVAYATIKRLVVLTTSAETKLSFSELMEIVRNQQQMLNVLIRNLIKDHLQTDMHLCLEILYVLYKSSELKSLEFVMKYALYLLAKLLMKLVLVSIWKNIETWRIHKYFDPTAINELLSFPTIDGIEFNAPYLNIVSGIVGGMLLNMMRFGEICKLIKQWYDESYKRWKQLKQWFVASNTPFEYADIP